MVEMSKYDEIERFYKCEFGFMSEFSYDYLYYFNTVIFSMFISCLVIFPSIEYLF